MQLFIQLRGLEMREVLQPQGPQVFIVSFRELSASSRTDYFGRQAISANIHFWIGQSWLIKVICNLVGIL